MMICKSRTWTPSATLSGLTVVDDNTIDVKLSQPDSAFPVKSGSHAYMPLAGIRVQGSEEVR